jgi:DNA-binding NarL/FixJ family response regulator
MRRRVAIDSRAMTDEPRPAAQSSPADTLSRREREIAELVSKGHTNRHIASTLSLSTRTVETYVKRIFAKLSASSRSEVAAIIVRSEGVVYVSRLAGLPCH